VAQANLEQTLRSLPEIGRLVKERPNRQVWRFEFEAKPYYLKFYPRNSVGGGLDPIRQWLRRRLRGSSAVLEFTRLQMLQRARIPAPRAIAVLVGFRIKDQLGDAVIMEALEPSVALDEYLSGFELRGEMAPDHREISRQIRELVRQLVETGLGHGDLHLGNLVLKDGKVHLIDGFAVRKGMRSRDLFRLAHSVAPFATLTDLMRGWELLAGGDLPKHNPMSEPLRQAFLKRVSGDNRYFGRLRVRGWSGVFFRSSKFAKRWSIASTLQIEKDDWERAWPQLWQQVENDELKILKRSRSGDVMAAEVALGGKTVPIVIKRPHKGRWYRYINEIPRASRSWRGWLKGWSLIARNLPTAWPLLVIERRRFGYITDHISIFERVPGTTLGRTDLDALAPSQREMLFRRAGRILRMIDNTGLSHFDAKAPNWIVREDCKLGPSPVLIDTDAVRFRRWVALGIQRLLKSMREHAGYTPADSLSLCLGYAPYSVPRLDDGSENGQAEPQQNEAIPSQSSGTPGEEWGGGHAG
jgi:tRNA A-37 threonylcarbamoyl transferase component Bud32